MYMIQNLMVHHHVIILSIVVPLKRKGKKTFGGSLPVLDKPTSDNNIAMLEVLVDTKAAGEAMAFPGHARSHLKTYRESAH